MRTLLVLGSLLHCSNASCLPGITGCCALQFLRHAYSATALGSSNTNHLLGTHSAHLRYSPGIVAGVVLARPIHRRRGNVVAPPPNQHLVLPVLVDGLLLVQPLQSAVMPLVELPRLRGGDPHEVRLLEDVPEGADGALLEGREGDVGDDAGVLDEIAGLDYLLVSLGGEGNVDPPGELNVSSKGEICA